MGAESPATVCEGVLEKKVDHRRIPIGPAWKRKYCVLTSEAFRIFRSKSKASNGCLALRTVPLCHIKGAAKVYEDAETKATYFNVFTEQGETLSFRGKSEVGWVAQIQILQIQYKNRQDILRMKCRQANDPGAISNNVIHRLRAAVTAVSSNNNDVTKRSNECLISNHSGADCVTVELPISRNGGTGIGITVIPSHGGRVLVNRLLDGGPAKKLGVIKPRDQILSANGFPVASVETLTSVVQNSTKSVTLVVRQRNPKSTSPIMEDPKHFLTHRTLYRPDYVNTKPYSDAKKIFEKGYTE